MASYQFMVVLLATVTVGQQPPGPDYYTAATAASRALSNQLQYLEQAIVAVPETLSPPWGNGEFQQCEDILGNLQVLRQQLNNKAATEALALSFDGIDRKLNALSSEIKGMERWNPGVRMTARRVRYALQDLHFAILGGDSNPTTKTQAALRQTLALQDRTVDCLGVVRYVFTEQASLPAWNAGFADFRGTLTELQKLEQTKASRDDIKQQLVKADQSWASLVDRFNKVGTDSNLLLRSNFALVDRQLARLSTLYGVPDRRPPLRDPFAD